MAAELNAVARIDIYTRKEEQLSTNNKIAFDEL